MNKAPCVIYHQPVVFTRRSAFPALADELKARTVRYAVSWERLQERSWTAGHWLRQWGIRHYGSTWNALIPWWDEWRMAREVWREPTQVVHFLWGEFASPMHPAWFRRPGTVLLGMFHCSARRLPSVLDGMKNIGVYDAISVVSKTQVPYFLRRGYREDQVRVIPLGVDTAFFRPAAARGPSNGPLRAILIGQTERDHAFTADVMRRLPAGTVRLQIRTDPSYFVTYRDIPGCELLPRLSDDDLVQLYQASDLMVMPMLDCTANDAMLECMACGTPVMTNDVGGIPEYVDGGCNVVMPGKDPAAWAARLVELARNRQALEASRIRVRAWAERFSWARIARDVEAFYRDALGRISGLRSDLASAAQAGAQAG